MSENLKRFGGVPATVLTEEELIILISGKTVTHSSDFDLNSSLIYKPTNGPLTDSHIDESKKVGSALALDYVLTGFYLDKDFPKLVFRSEEQIENVYTTTLYLSYLSAYIEEVDSTKKEYIIGILLRFIQRILDVFGDINVLLEATKEHFSSLDLNQKLHYVELFKALYRSQVIRSTHYPIQLLITLAGNDPELIYAVIEDKDFEYFNEKLKTIPNDVLSLYIELLRIRGRNLKEITKEEAVGLIHPYRRNVNKMFFAVNELYVRTKDPAVGDELMRMYKNDPGFTVHMPKDLLKGGIEQ